MAHKVSLLSPPRSFKNVIRLLLHFSHSSPGTLPPPARGFTAPQYRATQVPIVFSGMGERLDFTHIHFARILYTIKRVPGLKIIHPRERDKKKKKN